MTILRPLMFDDVALNLLPGCNASPPPTRNRRWKESDSEVQNKHTMAYAQGVKGQKDTLLQFCLDDMIKSFDRTVIQFFAFFQHFPPIPQPSIAPRGPPSMVSPRPRLLDEPRGSSGRVNSRTSALADRQGVFLFLEVVPNQTMIRRGRTILETRLLVCPVMFLFFLKPFF